MYPRRSELAVDVTPVNHSGYLVSDKLKTSLPHGWKSSAIRQPATPQLMQAQTATGADRHLLFAGMLFALAMMLVYRRKLT